MTSPEPRWRQRLENLQRALGQLRAALEALAREPDNEVIGMAVIKAYELSFELRMHLRHHLSALGNQAQTLGDP
jgi:hypothetical protein